ncbi:MAG: ABC transporter permease subunit [Oligoflexus sp.]|jgi:branched-chain amino acid transport system permease protein
MNSILQNFADGLALGSIYALIGFSFFLLYGTHRIMNLALGSLALAACLMGNILHQSVGLNFAAVTLASMLVAGVVGYLSFFVLYQLLPDRTGAASLVACFSLWMLIEEMVTHYFSANAYRYVSFFGLGEYRIGTLSLQAADLTLIALAILLLGLLPWFLHRSTLGLAVYGLTDDPAAAAWVGVPIRRLRQQCFMVATALAALALSLQGAKLGQLPPMMAMGLTLKALVLTAVCQPLGYRYLLPCGLGLGLIECFALWYGGATMRDASVLILLLLLLITWQGRSKIAWRLGVPSDSQRRGRSE